MSSRGIRVVPDVLRTSAFGAIGVAYTAIGTVFLNPIRILTIKNSTNSGLFFSFDGINDNEYLPASSGEVLDFSANEAGGNTFPFIAAGTTIYVRYQSGAPTSGIVAVSAYYCIGD